ncbi:hypothetical protein DICVIV_05672 [Dictyocaulus viviparus]|uniref:PH domain-containing protein n=1 Tax=Dictyocaulus viviparus TaxID=29172 RepID=A0A0D8XUD4_DICVI|nr:hypothetical protein DICVIV_05672 [Dictyocaulus viviparus]
MSRGKRDFNCLRIATQDGAEYIFACTDEQQMHEWVAKQLSQCPWYLCGVTKLDHCRVTMYHLYQYGAAYKTIRLVPPHNSLLLMPVIVLTIMTEYCGKLLLDSNDCNSLSRGVLNNMEASLRLCSTLPRVGSCQQKGVESVNSSTNSLTNMPVLIGTRKVARRSSKRQSIYSESIYGDLDDVEDLSKDDTRGSVSNSCATRASPILHSPTSSNGYMETLAYREHSSSTYTRDTPSQQNRDGRVTESVEFISWVENNQPFNKPSPSSTPTSCHDTESLKSETEVTIFLELIQDFVQFEWNLFVALYHDSQ